MLVPALGLLLDVVVVNRNVVHGRRRGRRLVHGAKGAGRQGGGVLGGHAGAGIDKQVAVDGTRVGNLPLAY